MTTGDNPLRGRVGEAREKLPGLFAAGGDADVGPLDLDDMVGRSGDRGTAGHDGGEAPAGGERSAPRPFGDALGKQGAPGTDRPVGEEAVEIVGELARGGVAPRGIALQAFFDDRAEVERDSREPMPEARRAAERRAPQRIGCGPAFVGRLPCEHRQERATDGMDVGGRADGPQEGIEAGLLRRHVARCAHHGRDLREMAGGIVGAGKAEVDELRRAGIGGGGASGEENILRLDVAVDDAEEMKGFERPGEIAADPGGLSGRERAPLDPAPEGLPCHPLHDEIGEPVGGAGGEDADDVGMIEAGQQERFPFGSGVVFGSEAPGTGQHLRGHASIERGVTGLVDDSHAAAGHEPEVIEAGDGGNRRRGAFQAGGDGDVGSLGAHLRQRGLGLGTGPLSPDVAPQAPGAGDLLPERRAGRTGFDVGKDRGAIGGGQEIVEEVFDRGAIRADR